MDYCSVDCPLCSVVEKKWECAPFMMSGQRAYLSSQYWCLGIRERRGMKKQRSHKVKTLRTHRV